jgi:aspartate racemase
MGTKATMSAAILFQQYSDRGVEAVVPSEDDQTYIDDIIFKDLSKGIFTAEARDRYLDIVDCYVEKGAQGDILGCTETPLLINQHDCPNVPMFDTLKLHVEVAVNMALE